MSDAGSYELTHEEVLMLRSVLRLHMEEMDRKMRYERGEYSRSRREQYDEIRALYIKLGGK